MVSLARDGRSAASSAAVAGGGGARRAWSALVRAVAARLRHPLGRLPLEPVGGFDAWLRRCEHVAGPVGDLARASADDPAVLRGYLDRLAREGFTDDVEAELWAEALGGHDAPDTHGPTPDNPVPHNPVRDNPDTRN